MRDNKRRINATQRVVESLIISSCVLPLPPHLLSSAMFLYLLVVLYAAELLAIQAAFLCHHQACLIPEQAEGQRLPGGVLD